MAEYFFKRSIIESKITDDEIFLPFISSNVFMGSRLCSSKLRVRLSKNMAAVEASHEPSVVIPLKAVLMIEREFRLAKGMLLGVRKCLDALNPWPFTPIDKSSASLWPNEG